MQETVGQEFDACTVAQRVVAAAAARAVVTRIVRVVAGQRRDRRTPDTSWGRRWRNVVSVSGPPGSADLSLADRGCGSSTGT